MVRGLAPGGFVGHIGGDDFICNLPFGYLEVTCDRIIQLFDELIPYQYTEEDRRAGYFLGKYRRGNIHRIPLMALSIGVVTNQFQIFEYTGQINELAAEIKMYAKSLPGSKYVVDRRHQSPVLPTASAEDAETLAGPDRRLHRPRSTSKPKRPWSLPSRVPRAHPRFRSTRPRSPRVGSMLDAPSAVTSSASRSLPTRLPSPS